MHWLLDIKNVVIEIKGYPISYIEAFSVLTALVSVWLAAKNNIHTWTVGIVSVIAFFFLFYQVQLYSDMLLQAFFLVTSALGILWWNKAQSTLNKLSKDHMILVWLLVLFFSWALGMFMKDIHTILPLYFTLPAEYPFSDAFTTVGSIVATILLIRRTLQTWILWLSIDAVAIVVYYQRDLYVVSAEYLVFACMALYGLYRWNKEFKFIGALEHG